MPFRMFNIRCQKIRISSFKFPHEFYPHYGSAKSSETVGDYAYVPKLLCFAGRACIPNMAYKSL